MNRYLHFFIFLFFGSLANGEIRISLNSGQNTVSWSVSNQNKSIQIPANIPGGIYTDLQAAGILEKNLFYRFNDMEYRWVGRENWTYIGRFDVDSKALQKKVVKLVLHGVDTVADVYLNGVFLKSIDNMFVRHVLAVEKIVKEKDNVLEVRLKSPIYEAARRANLHKESYAVPPECVPNAYNGECHVNFLRKMQASFAWDWGPAFPSVGIWKSIEIEAYNFAVVRDVYVHAYKEGKKWKVNTTSYSEYSNGHIQRTAKARVYMFQAGKNKVLAEASIVEQEQDSTVKNGFIASTQLSIDEKLLEAWWPNGMGDQTLYTVTVCVEPIDKSENSNKTVVFALRTVELVQEEITPGKPGLSFYFKVNNIPFFAKGSNWIPSHILPELGSDESTLRNLLQAAKDANMNMLRVWGGGVYESDRFYEIADELGIFIWQDMMFACAMYPTNKDFIDSVKIEIQQQVRRLQSHPSIIVWAGNNENEAALRGNWYGTAHNFSLYKDDYVKLYINLTKPVVRKNDKSRSYLTSSPSNGKESDAEGHVARDPYSPLYGDVHFYNYLSDGWSDSIYPDTRFASEYGFQSMPSFQSMTTVSMETDRKLNSEFTKKRQHLPAGNEFLTASILRHLPLPEDDGSQEFYKTYIYYSQITQAMSTKTETEKYRRDRSKLTEDNKGQTMGAMYWQLNDVWQAPSWSSIEFGGKWKMLQYFAKKFFSPLLVSPVLTKDNKLKVYLVSDFLYDMTNARLNISIHSWDRLGPIIRHSYKVTVEKASSKLHKSYNLLEMLNAVSCDKYTCYIHVEVGNSSFSSENFLFPSKINEVKNIKKPKLQVKVEPTDDPRKVAVQVTTDRVAPFVWLETEESGEFSDNGFLLQWSSNDLIFENRQNEAVDLEKMKSTLTVRSLL